MTVPNIINRQVFTELPKIQPPPISLPPLVNWSTSRSNPLYSTMLEYGNMTKVCNTFEDICTPEYKN